ncbi:elongation factor P 5-aminopentanone reductase [Liquorilactobacillus oeni]|uniref:3-oxoacyl-acyl carrier protein reductase n=1 Tax=Liquorilactobacillus oeni DSM 19972 TaxID=1423777 RepID=A0A0R1M8W1_9LACO|nr:SDR family NAD(P)-dependent oxidoreductase [Liquorilactobacillus oeni]KRL04781.1 3-oxoacyl-acyl carrier protein reductase [Liquorilactobacillus oeni DSM 19972]
MKWALVIGASGDIGSDVVQDLAQRGWSLYLHYNKNSKRIADLIAQLRQRYSSQDFLGIQADLLKENSAEKVKEQLFCLDALIFAEGTTSYGLFREMPSAQLHEMLQMQIVTPFRLIQLLEDKLAQNHFGRIIFIGSVYGGAGSAMEVGYSTVKGALTAFAAAYSKEVASLGVTVNVIAPGAVATQMNKLFTVEEKNEIDDKIPLGRFASTSEISYWVCAMLKERASYMTGQTIYVTGGWLK